ncbi:27345_t:CDS:2, partial [Dentiscutata erythropus]
LRSTGLAGEIGYEISSNCFKKGSHGHVDLLGTLQSVGIVGYVKRIVNSPK